MRMNMAVNTGQLRKETHPFPGRLRGNCTVAYDTAFGNGSENAAGDNCSGLYPRLHRCPGLSSQGDTEHLAPLASHDSNPMTGFFIQIFSPEPQHLANPPALNHEHRQHRTIS